MQNPLKEFLKVLVFSLYFFLLVSIFCFSMTPYEFSLSLTAENGDRIAGFILEPIQGEAGVCFM